MNDFGAFLLEENPIMSFSGVFWKKYRERMLKERKKLNDSSG